MRSRVVSMKRVINKLLFAVVVIVILIPTVFFFYWMIVLSVRTNVENTAYPTQLIPRSFILDNYQQVFIKNPFFKYLLNSSFIAVCATLLGLGLGLPAAYSIAKWKQKRISMLILVSRMFPHISYLLPWFIFFRIMGLINTYTAVILSHVQISLPLITWMMISYFEDAPQDLGDAAQIDGCSEFREFISIYLPIVRPGILVSAILCMIYSWNNFLFAVVLSGYQTRTLPVAVYGMINFEEVVWGQLAAAAAVITLPIIVITFVFQRYIVAGLTIGAVKD